MNLNWIEIKRLRERWDRDLAAVKAAQKECAEAQARLYELQKVSNETAEALNKALFPNES